MSSDEGGGLEVRLRLTLGTTFGRATELAQLMEDTYPEVTDQ